MKISIITACYNSERTIEQTLLSVLNQTYNNIEYIIIDGCSTDGTLSIIDKYKDEGIILVSEPDDGVYDAFNKGVEYSKGDYILFLNSDDYLINELVIERLVETLIKSNYPIGIYGDIYIKNERTGYIFRYGKQFDLESIKTGSMPPHPATLLSKGTIEEFEGFDTTYKIAADFDLMVKVFLKYNHEIIYTPLIVSLFRLGGLSSHIGTQQLVKEETNQIIQNHFLENKTSKFKELSNEDYMKIWLENIVFSGNSLNHALKLQNIKQVVIFGSGEMAVLIAHDLIRNGVNVLGFLDNSLDRQGIIMNGIRVFPPNWLKSNYQLIDAIIFGFQGHHEDAVNLQLDSYELGKQIKRISWRKLIDEVY